MMMISRRPTIGAPLSRRRRGIAAVEWAVAMPFIMILLLGAWEVGRLIEVQQILNNAVREGGRQASTGLVSNSGVQQVVLTYLQNAGVVTTNAAVSVSDLTAPGTDAQNAAQMDQLQISVTMPFNDVRWISLNLVTTATTQLTAQTVWYSLKDQAYPGSISAPPGS